MQGESTSFAVMLRSTFDDGALTAIEYAGKPAWIASDVGRALGMADHREASRRLREHHPDGGAYWYAASQVERDELKRVGILDPHQNSATLIFEPGLYWLMMTSATPKADAFRAWLAEVHLPELRRGAVERTAMTHDNATVAWLKAHAQWAGAETQRLKAERAAEEARLKVEKKRADRDFKLANARQELDHWRTRHRIMEQKLQAAWRNDAKMRIKLGMPPINYAAEFTFTDDA